MKGNQLQGLSEEVTEYNFIVAIGQLNKVPTSIEFVMIFLVTAYLLKFSIYAN